VTSRTRLLAGVLVVVLIGAAAAWAFTRDDDAAERDLGDEGAKGASELAVIAVRGTANPLIAVVGVDAERPPAALVIPGGVTFVAPGQGETTAEGVAALQGESIRIAVSNAIGRWADHLGMSDVATLSSAVDDAGGLTVELSEPATIEGAELDAGPHELTGAQVAAFLAETGEIAPIRWAEVLEALLETSELGVDAFTESDDPAALADLLGRAAGAAVEIAPVAPVADTASVLDQPAFDDRVRELFGGRPATPIVVQNGNGEPNVGETVASLLLPGGFRIVVSQNADTFRHRQTEIAATAAEFADEAERVRELLGVGSVVVSQVPSGLADITIVVGRDFTA
jgi:hypothetical protein